MPSGPRSRRLPEPWIFFIDRSLGGQVVAEALRAAGEQVEVHDDHFARDASDETWLGAVGAKGWVVLSKTIGFGATLSSEKRSSQPGSRHSSSAEATYAGNRWRR